MQYVKLFNLVRTNLLFASRSLYIYIYIYVCVWVCVFSILRRSRVRFSFRMLGSKWWRKCPKFKQALSTMFLVIPRRNIGFVLGVSLSNLEVAFFFQFSVYGLFSQYVKYVFYMAILNVIVFMTGFLKCILLQSAREICSLARVKISTKCLEIIYQKCKYKMIWHQKMVDMP